MKSNRVVRRVGVWRVIAWGVALSSAIAMALSVAVLPAAAANSPEKSRKVVVVGTGRALVDISVLRHALRSVGPDGTVQLVGTFNLTGCVACVLIRDGITVEGVNARGRPAKATLVGGSFPFIIAVRDRGVGGGSGNLTLQRLHFTGQLGTAVYFFKTVSETRVLDNAVTNLTPITLLDGRRAVRGAMLAAQFFPNEADPGIREEILKRFPALARVMARFGGERRLQGNFTFSRNFIDLLTPAMSFGVDTAIGMFGDTFSKLTIDHNQLATYGETIENEFSRNPDGVRNIEHNTIIMVSIKVFESELFGVGNPCAISFQAQQARSINIVDNDVITSGTENGVGIGGGTATEATSWQVIGNRIRTAGQIPFPGGFHGLDPFFSGSSMTNTLYRNNTISGSAKYGFWFDAEKFEVTSHGDTLGPNDFSDFTPTSGITVFLGPQTFENTVIGPLNGGVTDLGTDNVINP